MGYSLPEEVWLTGKGPSLDSYKWQGHETVICVNETVFCVPNPFAAIAIDYAVLDKYHELQCIILRKSSHTQYQFENMWIWNMSDANISSHATAVIATQLLCNWGTTTIHYVGFDAIHGNTTHAKGLTGNRSTYPQISVDLLGVIHLLGITPIWEHQPKGTE